ncbi:redox-sensing transcriptional repressor Rex, partial [bacterium]
IAILATPPEAVDVIAAVLIRSGIQGSLNFTPATIKTPSGVFVHDVDVTMELEYRSFLVEKE